MSEQYTVPQAHCGLTAMRLLRVLTSIDYKSNVQSISYAIIKYKVFRSIIGSTICAVNNKEITCAAVSFFHYFMLALNNYYIKRKISIGAIF